MRGLEIAFCALLVAQLATTPSSAQQKYMFGANDLDPSWCETAAPRQTVVYIDDTLMVDGKTEWADQLSTKLRATLAPGERVTLVELSPRSGESHELWSGCWPAFTKAQKGQQSQGFSLQRWFSESPTARVQEQQRFFTRDLGEGLGKIYTTGKRPPSAVRTDPAAPPQKNIIRAIASDQARFTQSRTIMRAIIYSDMAENSDLGSVFKVGSGPPPNYGQQLGTYFRRTVFYAYGADEDVANDPGLLEQSRDFWIAALGSMRAAVGGFGVDLNVPNSTPSAAYDFDVVLSRGGQDLDGQMSLMVDSYGTLIDSLLEVYRLTTASLNGSFRCDSSTDTCKLSATTTNGIATLEPSETVSLSGNAGSVLVGELGAKGAVFPIKARKTSE